MANKEYYVISKNISKILEGKHTNFLDPNVLQKVTSKLKKETYKIYKPYKESERIILYVDEIPKINLIEIVTNEKLEHREIMGTFYNLSIKTEMLGDIVINDGHYYIFVMNSIHSLIMEEVTKIGNKSVKLLDIPVEKAEKFKRKYEKLEIIVPSLRLDTVISKITKESRNTVKEKFNNNEIVLNYEICNKQTYVLKKGDIFSVKKYGKYRYEEIIGKNKKNNYIIYINKYTN